MGDPMGVSNPWAVFPSANGSFFLCLSAHVFPPGPLLTHEMDRWDVCPLYFSKVFVRMLQNCFTSFTESQRKLVPAQET